MRAPTSLLSLATARQILFDEAMKLGAFLEKEKLRLVLAESCSGGMASAALTCIPGMSEYFSGSLVTYRTDSKIKWLGVSPKALKKNGVVSEQVAAEMAITTLGITPEAKLAGSITGHLGPDAPKDLDGVVYCAVAIRVPDSKDLAVFTSRNRLAAPQKFSALDLRQWRQLAASHSLLMVVRSLLEDLANPDNQSTVSFEEEPEMEAVVVKNRQGAKKKNGTHPKNKRRKR